MLGISRRLGCEAVSREPDSVKTKTLLHLGCNSNPSSQLTRYGSGDRASSPRVGMPVPPQPPRRINFDKDVRYPRIVENAATQHLFRLRFIPKLQHDEKRRRPTR